MRELDWVKTSQKAGCRSSSRSNPHFPHPFVPSLTISSLCFFGTPTGRSLNSLRQITWVLDFVQDHLLGRRENCLGRVGGRCAHMVESVSQGAERLSLAHTLGASKIRHRLGNNVFK